MKGIKSSHTVHSDKCGLLLLYACWVIVFAIWCVHPVSGQTLRESDHVERIAGEWGAESEVRLEDGTRADMRWKRYIIEVDYVDKWYEGVGQAQYYALLTGMRPGLVLLLRDPDKEWRDLARAARLCENKRIRLWVIKVSP
jgi:hypothetical protein|tara:strand:- start:1162 stop:1584 length:423 start_codon:yes stop_codon:yes gene_type:complete